MLEYTSEQTQCLGILALICVFNKKLHRPEFISFPLLMSTREMLPEEGLLDKIVSHWYAQHMKLLQVTEEYGNKGLALSSFSFFVHTEQCDGIR